MSRIFQPLFDEFPSLPLAAEVPERHSGSAASEDGCRLASDTLNDVRFLGEIGGVLFPPSLLERYQQSGGAVYRPLVPFASAPQARFDDSVRVGARRSCSRSLSWSSPSVAANVLCVVMSPILSVAPWLRLVVPRPLNCLANRPLRLDERNAVWASLDGHVVAMVFHPHLPLMALALKDNAGHHRLVLYDVSAEKLLPLALTHPLQTGGVYALAWKLKSKDCLLVACAGGVLAWCLGYFQLSTTDTFSIGGLMGGRPRLGGGNGGGIADVGGTAGQSWWSGFVTDASPACVFYRCCGGECVTSIAQTACGRYVAAASERSIYATVHDISQPPDDALVLHSAAAEGGTSAVLFAPNDAYLLRSLRHCKSLKLLYMDSLTVETFPLSQSVEHICSLAASPAWSDESTKTTGGGRDSLSASHLYAVQFERTEGVAIIRVVTTSSTAVSERSDKNVATSSSVLITCLIATGVVRGIGGRVESMTFSGQRMYVTVASGHLVVLAVRVTDDAVYVRSVGAVAVKDRTSILAASPNFPKGSLIAYSHQGEVHFVPSYYRR